MILVGDPLERRQDPKTLVRFRPSLIKFCISHNTIQT
eukprot:COSAG03_NODE_9148_length_743_cov_0.736025_1_plen_36_part_10